MSANELRMPTRLPAWREDGLMRSLGAPFALLQPPQSLPEPHWVERKTPLKTQLEAAIGKASEGDFGEVQRLLRLLQRPFDEQPGHEADAGFPPGWVRHLEVSCSS